MILAATGHRPDKLGGYDRRTESELVQFAKDCLERRRPGCVISGMALGWDIAIAAAAVRLGIPFVAAIPFKGQESRWTPSAQAFYANLLRKAQDVVIVSPGGYAPEKMHARNEFMVDSADRVLALWNGSAGGTAGCCAYAFRKGVPVDNVWPLWNLPADVAALIG